MSPLQRVIQLWEQRTPRERTLALCVAGLLGTFLVLVGIRAAIHSIENLDRQIARMQSDIVNYSYQIARRQAVEARYAEVAAQHSSAWSESEIRDRLRQEIYRLSYRKPPKLDANGIPVTTDSEGEALVRIPELRGGQLVEGGDGFRAYQIEFEVPPTPFPDMLAYLENLAGSPQSLRIDHIDLRRDPARPEVAARVGLTRIVVDDPSGGADQGMVGDESMREYTMSPLDWTCEGCEVSAAPSEAGAILRASGTAAKGRLYLARSLPAGKTYDIELELSASAPVTVKVDWDGRPANEADAIAIPARTAYTRCHLRFAVPRDSGDRVPVRVPLLSWEGEGAELQVRRLRVFPIDEVADET